MSTTTASFSITPDRKVGDIVTAKPILARIFQRLGIDYCCGGKITLAAACARQKLDPLAVVLSLEAEVANAGTDPSGVNAAGMTLTELADHIESTHHEYVKAELPRLDEMAERVAGKHAWRDDRLPEVRALVRALLEEMSSHMQKEEGILFPLVRQIEAGGQKQFHGGGLANPIQQMEDEHESAGRAVARLRELTDGFIPNAEACNTHRALLAGLEEFEQDLHTHVHKENSILFPRALDLAARN